MLENPWRHLEENSASESVQSISFNAESIESSEADNLGDNSDQEADSPDVLVESITECSPDDSRDETSLSDISGSQKSACQDN